MISLLKKPSTISPSNIDIILNDTIFENSDPLIEQQMQEIWNAYCAAEIARGANIQNLDNYRLDSVTYDDQDRITMHLSIVSYAIKIAFREYLRKGHSIDEFEENELPRGIGIGGLLKTSDSKYIFGVKSGKTNAQFSTGFIGGIPTRDEIQIGSGKDLGSHLVNEIHEETGVFRDEIKSLVIIDIVLSDSGSVMILTETELNIPAEEVMKRFLERTDPSELSQLLVVNEGNDLRELLERNKGYYSHIWELHRNGLKNNELDVK